MERSELRSLFKQQAISLLSRREHAELELKQKLKRKVLTMDDEVKQLAEALIDEVVHELQESGYQSDIRYIEMMLRSRVDRGYGEQRIRQELMQYRISEEDLQQCIEALEIDWFALAQSVREKRYGLESVKHDPKLKAKQMRHLFSRGFNSEQVSFAMNTSDHED